MITTISFEEPVFDSPLRAYVLLHTYFKSLLNGVQGGHACVELSFKYEPDTMEARMYKQWSRQDKTLLFLDGGVSLHLHGILGQLQSLGQDAHMPWAHVNEDEATLEGMLTAVVVVLPESIVKADALDWEAAKTNHTGLIHDDLVKLGMTFSNNQVFTGVIDWLRSRPLAT